MPTLLVIDAQKGKLDALHPQKRRRILQNIEDEVTIATINGDGVIFTSEVDQEVHPNLAKLIKGYKRASRVAKGDEDGGPEVIRALESRRFSKSYIRACGLYTLSSVEATISTLSAQLEDSIIEIAAGAVCGLNRHEDYDYDWAWFLSNVTVTDSGRQIRRQRRYTNAFFG